MGGERSNYHPVWRGPQDLSGGKAGGGPSRPGKCEAPRPMDRTGLARPPVPPVGRVPRRPGSSPRRARLSRGRIAGIASSLTMKRANPHPMTRSATNLSTFFGVRRGSPSVPAFWVPNVTAAWQMRENIRASPSAAARCAVSFSQWPRSSDPGHAAGREQPGGCPRPLEVRIRRGTEGAMAPARTSSGGASLFGPGQAPVTRSPARKPASSTSPRSVRIDSGCSWTPSTGSVRWRIPISTPSPVYAVATRSSGRSPTTSEW